MSLFAALGLYGLLVINNLSTIQSAGAGSLLSAVLSVNKGTGISDGYVILWVGLLFQLVAVLLYGHVKAEIDEDLYFEQKSKTDFWAEACAAEGLLRGTHDIYGSTCSGRAINANLQAAI